MTRHLALLRALVAGDVRFVLVGGVAAALHGAARATYDVDVVYSRDEDNLLRLVAALRPLSPYPRGAPPGLPFVWDVRTVRSGLNFTLRTDLGDLDVLGQVPGGDYDSLVGHTVETPLEGITIRTVDLPTLIRLKRAAGRPKDFEALAELELLIDEQDAR